MGLLDKDTVKRVRQALADAGQEDTVIELTDTARSAEDAAKAVGCELGAIVKSLVFAVGDRMVMALVAGDHTCLEENLPQALFLKGDVRRAQATEVKQATGFTIGGVAPVGLSEKMPVVIDRSLKRFEIIYAAAGHPHCVFPTTVKDLSRMTEGIISFNIAQSLDPAIVPVPLRRSKTMLKRIEEAADPA